MGQGKFQLRGEPHILQQEDSDLRRCEDFREIDSISARMLRGNCVRRRSAGDAVCPGHFLLAVTGGALHRSAERVS